MDEFQIEQIRVDLAWKIRHEVMYPNLPYDAIKLQGDEDGMHFGLFAGNKLTTVVSLFNVGHIFQFRKFATIVEAQGKGYGTIMLNHIISYVNTMDAEKLWCNARVSATGFYKKFGFVETSQRSQHNDVEFVIMELQLDN